MAFKTSIALRIAAGSGVGYRAALGADPSTHTAKLIFYSGTVPANADASIGSAVALCSFTNGAAGLSLSAAANVAGEAIMSKSSGETWQGTTIGAGGTPTFFRFTETGDVATDATGTYKRVQGTAGIGGTFDATITAAFETGATNTLNAFDWTIATY
jgi:hypothetical protein